MNCENNDKNPKTGKISAAIAKTSLAKLYIIFIILLFISFFLVLTVTGVFHKHDFVENTLKEATCEGEGLMEEYCRSCDYYHEHTLHPLGHAFVEERVIKEATCNEDGLTLDKCSVCNISREMTRPAKHKYLSGECDICGVRKSSISPDTWYTVSTNNVLFIQNAEIHRETAVSDGRAFMVTFYPVCKECHISGTMSMAGVSPNIPATETYYCDSCKTSTYVRLKIEY